MCVLSMQLNPRSVWIRDPEDRALFPVNDHFLIPEAVQTLHVEGTTRDLASQGSAAQYNPVYNMQDDISQSMPHSSERVSANRSKGTFLLKAKMMIEGNKPEFTREEVGWVRITQATANISFINNEVQGMGKELHGCFD